jgi:hypothetical protein
MTDRDSIKAKLSEKSSEELLAIYNARDTQEWQSVVFDIIPEILSERQVLFSSEPSPRADQTEEDVIARYNVLFDGIFASNGFGFVNEGTVSLGRQSIVFTGKIKWDIRKRVILFLALSVLPYALFKVGLGIIPAIIVLHFFCTSPGRVVILRKSIREYEQDGRQIQFMAEDPETGQIKKAVFTVDTVAHADEIAAELDTVSPNQALEATSESALDADSSAPQG